MLLRVQTIYFNLLSLLVRNNAILIKIFQLENETKPGYIF